ncbi:MAG: TetR/AcrR family transcriptional regulator [Cytophagaceae bacterium]|nr:TetR/AcrR family transcriptional regulator [Cytophagaceae bacterium]MBL0301427.1 TetR/AcrR family transcriptional regulator [Cytophagaceae bacterium]
MVSEISERQLEIIEAAGKILTNSGVSGLTIKNLAKEMKFSESAIYRHFTSKEEIIVELLEYLADSMDQRYQKVIKSSSSARDNFINIFHNQFEFFSSHPHFVVAVFSDGLMEESLRVNQTIFKIMQIKMKHLLPIIMQGQAEGTFTKAISAEEVAHIIMGAIRLQMFKWRISNFEFDLVRSGNNILESLITILEVKHK